MSEIIAGRNPVLEALKAGRPVNKILVDKNGTRHGAVAEILYLARNQGVPVEYVGRQVIERESPGISQGIIAYTAAKDYLSLPELFAISGKKKEPALYVVLDGIEDPQNLGAIIRTAEATGVHGIIIRSRREVGLTAAVSRASAGAIEYIAVARVPNIAQAIEDLKQSGIWVIGIDMTGDSDYRQVDYRPATALVLGGEGKGLSPLVRRRCDATAFIPMRGRISSLNASVSAALVMYEAFRQRNNK